MPPRCLRPFIRERRQQETTAKDLLAECVNDGVPMVGRGGSPLTPLAQEALDALTKAVPRERAFTYERAYAVLAEEEDLERPAAEEIVERLYMKGYLYEAEGKLRLTDY